MAKYIDAEAFFKLINTTLPYRELDYPDKAVYNAAISDVCGMLTHFPPADVQEALTVDDVLRWCEPRNYALVAKEDLLKLFCGTERHGHWKYTHDLYSCPDGNQLFYGKICSVCNNVSPYETPYCMNCGAKMDEGCTPLVADPILTRQTND